MKFDIYEDTAHAVAPGMELMRCNRAPQSLDELVDWGLRDAHMRLEKDGRLLTRVLCFQDLIPKAVAAFYFDSVLAWFGGNRANAWEAIRGMARNEACGSSTMTLLQAEAWCAAVPQGAARECLPQDLSMYDLSNERLILAAESPNTRLLHFYALVRDGRKVSVGPPVTGFDPVGAQSFGLGLCYRGDDPVPTSKAEACRN